ncbi:hypothetical protein [Methylophilus sp.]|uniref:hypothetical protein n=1 Tax=Methylophilus sp. TaxID=29541 RepID=UPI00403721D9
MALDQHGDNVMDVDADLPNGGFDNAIDPAIPESAGQSAEAEVTFPDPSNPDPIDPDIINPAVIDPDDVPGDDDEIDPDEDIDVDEDLEIDIDPQPDADLPEPDRPDRDIRNP